MMEMEIDVGKMPLGALSRTQIQRGFGVLTEIQAALDDPVRPAPDDGDDDDEDDDDGGGGVDGGDDGSMIGMLAAVISILMLVTIGTDTGDCLALAPVYSYS